MKLFRSIKQFFFNRYVALYQMMTLALLSVTNKKVRKLLILQGKNPDYVAPPPPPPVEPAWKKYDKEAAEKRITKARELNLLGTSSSDRWVKKPLEHPVLMSRQAYENKKTSYVDEEPLQVAAARATNEEEDFAALNSSYIASFLKENLVKKEDE